MITKIDILQKLIESCHVNFLIGSGLSRPYLSTLGPIEELLTELGKSGVDETTEAIIRSSLYKQYFDKVIYPNVQECTVKGGQEFKDTLNAYQDFLRTLNELLAKRHNSIIGKQVNIFTTNIDMFVERSANDIGIEFNDGFRGRINAKYDEDCFSRVTSKINLGAQKTSEIPTFNYMKIHGSIGWEHEGIGIEVVPDDGLGLVGNVKQALNKIDPELFIPDAADNKKTIDALEKEAEKIRENKPEVTGDTYKGFTNEYEKFVMVNPNKGKFRETVIDLHFYELMRLYSNALERPNSILFVAGFSFADEHLAQLTLRAANSNPTLQIIVFCYDDDFQAIKDNIIKTGSILNNNIDFITPSKYKEAQKEDGQRSDWVEPLTNFDLLSITKYVFSQINNNISLR